MGDAVEHFYTRVKARAFVGGSKVPISGFHAQYELNNIPLARVTIPIGRSASDGSVSEVEGLISGLAPYTPLRVELETASNSETGAAPAGKDPGFPQGTVDVFDGFIGEATYVRDRASKSVAVELLGFGKLGALAGATRYSDGLVIAGQHNGEEYVSSMLAKKDIGFIILDTLMHKLPDITSGLWENGLYPLFNAIIDEGSDVFNSEYGYKTGGGESLALQALEMVTAGNARMGAQEMTLMPDFVSLKYLAKSITRQLAHLFYGWTNKNARSDSSLLSLLMQSAQMFYFVIVPGVKDAATVPLFFGLDAEPDGNRVIDPDEYWSIASEPINFTPDFWAYPTTVALTSPYDLSEERSDSPIVCRPIGVATLNDRPMLLQATGKMLTEEAPSWALPYAPAPEGTVLPNIPDLGALGAYSPPPTSPMDALNKYLRSGIGDAIAENILHSVFFQRRVRQIDGRLRLDLCPGTLVKLNTAGEMFTGMKSTFYGFVGKVELFVEERGDHSVAGTKLTLTHMRTQEEHKGLTMPANPLYSGKWLGGKLTEY